MSLKSQMRKKKEKKHRTQQEPTRLAIGIPSTGLMQIATAQALAGLAFILGHSRSVTPMIIKTEGITIAEARNQIVMEAQGQNMDQLLFIDTDMVFPHDMYSRLSAHLNGMVKVVGCNYSRRDGTGVGVGIGLDGKRMNGEDTGMGEVKGLGAGMLLIDMTIFDKMEKPYFHELTLEDKLDSKDAMTRSLSEDFYFCNKVREAGGRVYCDADLSRAIGHVGSYTFFLNPKPIAVPTQ